MNYKTPDYFDLENLSVVAARQSDASVFTSIAFEAKRHWGYPEEWIQLWKNDLTITPDFILGGKFFKVVHRNEILGFVEFECHGDNLEINHFWILPEYIGKGVGRKLFEESLKLMIAKSNNRFEEVKVVSDPNAQGFYERLGFKISSVIEGKPAGRFLPELVLLLSEKNPFY